MKAWIDATMMVGGIVSAVVTFGLVAALWFAR